MAAEVPPIVPSAGLATDQEIMKQALGKIGQTLEAMNERQERQGMDAMRRSQSNGAHQNGASAPPKLHVVTVFLAVLSPLLTVIGGGYFMTAYWRGQDATEKRFEAIETEQVVSRKERAELKAGFEQLQKDRAARIADLDQWRKSTEDELRLYRIANSEFQQMKGTVSEIGKKLSDGRDERLRDRETDRANQQKDREQMVEAINSLKTEVALLRQSVEREARGRNSERAPFDQNRMWSAPSPFILETIYRPRLDVAAIIRGGR